MCRRRADQLQADLDRALQQTMAASMASRAAESAATAGLQQEVTLGLKAFVTPNVSVTRQHHRVCTLCLAHMHEGF